MNSAEPATVQALCTVMHIRDAIIEPLAAPAVQRPHLPLAVEENPSSVAEQLPTVIRPLPAAPTNPQNVVSDTLDKIMDVRERMSAVEKTCGISCCSAEKQQLEVELNIASRQIQQEDDAVVVSERRPTLEKRVILSEDAPVWSQNFFIDGEFSDLFTDEVFQSLDDRTKQACLLRELEAIDKKIENLSVSAESIASPERK
ncbi:unnamed protein product [Gongylonema pulchrum]|uniref:Uncharacterized protein n=1 Tax=Gongylonema pulchrum TaxID=637853 RepID=A0A183EJ46_9BILA|nr:unnamed protein product [Gongylonema pulchrum]